MQAPDASKITHALEPIFCQALTQALKDACRSSWRAVVSEQPASSAPESSAASYFKFSFTGALEGEAFFVLRSEEIATLAFRAIAQSGVQEPAAPAEEHAKAFCAALESSTALITRLLVEHGVVNVSAQPVFNPDLPAENPVELWVEADDVQTRVSILLFLDARLAECLRASSARPFDYPSVAGGSSANLERVLDVELNVTLRFGQRRLPLREVLDLASGSVVELDRQVDEPVELVLDGRVVARGEAVIIDGNYGMRITQVLQNSAH